MRTILKQFYFGNLMPSERKMPQSSNLHRAVNRISQCERQLMEQLNEGEQTLLKEMTDAQAEVNSITACDNFILGFRLGVIKDDISTVDLVISMDDQEWLPKDWQELDNLKDDPVVAKSVEQIWQALEEQTQEQGLTMGGLG